MTGGESSSVGSRRSLRDGPGHLCGKIRGNRCFRRWHIREVMISLSLSEIPYTRWYDRILKAWNEAASQPRFISITREPRPIYRFEFWVSILIKSNIFYSVTVPGCENQWCPPLPSWFNCQHMHVCAWNRIWECFLRIPKVMLYYCLK